MSNIIQKSTNEPLGLDFLSWHEKWCGDDKGLIACWAQGKKLALTNERLVKQVKNNELPVLPWKGGYEQEVQKKIFHVSYHYYAMWLGLRGEDLQINLDNNIEITCPKTKMTTIFTNNEKLFDR